MTTLPEKITPAEAPSLYVKGGLTPFLNIIRAEALAEVPDVTTAIEKPGRAYLKYLKDTLIKDAETELREFVRACDEIRDAVRQPLTDLENKERARVQGHSDAMGRIREIGAFPHTTKAAALEALATLAEWVLVAEKCEEFLPAYQATLEEAWAAAVATLERLERAESEIAERAVSAERLRVARAAEAETERRADCSHRVLARAEAARLLTSELQVPAPLAELIVTYAEAGRLGRLRLAV